MPRRNYRFVYPTYMVNVLGYPESVIVRASSEEEAERKAEAKAQRLSLAAGPLRPATIHADADGC